MIYGIGIDLVNVQRFNRVIDRWGMRFLRRVFTMQEINFCFQRPRPASSFALRFAAKEAFSKALGLGMRNGITWQDIEVINHQSGRPDLTITGKALRFCQHKGIMSWHVTLSDEGDYGSAMVIIEKSGAAKKRTAD